MDPAPDMFLERIHPIWSGSNAVSERSHFFFVRGQVVAQNTGLGAPPVR